MSLTLIRIAHATVLLDFDDQPILTDPWFSEKPGYYHGEPLGIERQNLPTLAGVVATHDHYDHYDMDDFAAYPDKQVPFLVKTGMAAVARQVGFERITELEPWQTATLGSILVTAVPARHSVPENCYVLQADGLTVFFGGDTLLIPELAEVATRFPRLDLALLPVNGLRIRPYGDLQVVMNAREAAQLCAWLHPRIAVPIHYRFTAGPDGDRELLKYDGTPEEFAEEAARVAPETHVTILAPGEPLHLRS